MLYVLRRLAVRRVIQAIRAVVLRCVGTEWDGHRKFEDRALHVY